MNSELTEKELSTLRLYYGEELVQDYLEAKNSMKNLNLLEKEKIAIKQLIKKLDMMPLFIF